MFLYKIMDCYCAFCYTRICDHPDYQDILMVEEHPKPVDNLKKKSDAGKTLL